MNFKRLIIGKKDGNKSNLIVIKTARDIESINNACREGYFPLIKPVKPLQMIRTKFSVLQNINTGEVEMIKDFRSGKNRISYFFDEAEDEPNSEQPEYKTVIDWTYYYPYQFELPFAAYLIPKELKKGKRVFVEDLIEDFIGHAWNQGDTYRLESCEAIWTGSDLEIQYNPRENFSEFIG
jgi:hypothetical protein